MGPLRNSKPKHSRKQSTARLQLTRSPSQSLPSQVLLKKQRHKQHRAVIAFAALKARRERWAGIARDSLRIVCGDGKYVEERPSFSSSSSSSVYFSSAYAPGPSKAQPQGTIHVVHDIAPHIQLSKQLTTFYPHSSPSLAEWRRRPTTSPQTQTTLTFTSTTTLTAARTLHLSHPSLTSSPSRSLPTSAIGVLAFSSPKRPGGGYLHGGDEQEEALARSTSLVAGLDTEQGREFYSTHKAFSGVDGKGIYDHSMVYCPGVVAFRKEDDDTLDPPVLDPTTTKHRSKPKPKPKPKSSTPAPAPAPTHQPHTIPPYPLNILSSTPPSYAAIHQTYTITPSTSHIFSAGIKSVLTQRLGRVLRTFEERGDRAVVLGAYGCGSSEVRVEMVAGVWAELLVCGEEEEGEGGRGEARFKDVFEHVVFAVPGKLFAPFKEAFEMRVLEAQINDATRL